MRRVAYSPQSQLYQNYYAEGGSLAYFRGDLYHPAQYGRGLGTRVLSSLMNIAIPLVKPLAQRALQNIVGRIGKSKSKIVQNVVKTGLDVAENAIRSKQGRKRSRQTPPTRKTSKRRRDIFDV